MTAVVDDATTPAGATVERLLDAAEMLFAERGIDAVSVRAINAAAGANVAAVHYHFGSKDALVEAVLRRRMDALGARRLAMIDALPDGRTPEPRAVVEALVVPLAELSADPGGPGRAYVRVLATLQSGDDGRRRLGTAFAPQFAPFDAALARALPSLADPVRHFRLGLVGGLVVSTLADPEAAAASLGLDPAAHDAVVNALVDTVTGALAAPVTTKKGTRR
ncbi:MAG: TetR/AcrR family transcriptional regulator [Actinobacteria bacterium]|nr:TetR/AcrR family transcriptional regulator [Actinomycetota bacterium]